MLHGGPGHCVGAPIDTSELWQRARTKQVFSQAFGGDDPPANHCNGRFRVGDKSKRVPVHRSAKTI